MIMINCADVANLHQVLLILLKHCGWCLVGLLCFIDGGVRMLIVNFYVVNVVYADVSSGHY